VPWPTIGRIRSFGREEGGGRLMGRMMKIVLGKGGGLGPELGSDADQGGMVAR
jgi:hypothetical protein